MVEIPILSHPGSDLRNGHMALDDKTSDSLCMYLKKGYEIRLIAETRKSPDEIASVSLVAFAPVSRLTEAETKELKKAVADLSNIVDKIKPS